MEVGVDYCDESPGLRKCEELVVFRDPCGHERKNVPCHLAFAWAEDYEDAPPCAHVVPMRNPLCHHDIIDGVPCHVAQKLERWIPWTAEPEPEDEIPWERVTRESSNEDGVHTPSLSHDMPAPAEFPQGVDREDLCCGCQSLVTLACGHHVHLPCVQAFQSYNAWTCTELVIKQCSDCGHRGSVACHKDEAQKRTGRKPCCKHMVKKPCSTCGINEQSVHCHKKDVRCNKEVSVIVSSHRSKKPLHLSTASK